MKSPEISLFLWVNADAGTPQAVVMLAQAVSEYLPSLVGAALVLAAGVLGPRARAAACQAALAMMLGWICARALREGLQVPRPAALGLGTQWVAHGTGPGLPSMHATGAFAFAFALLRAGLPRTAWLPAFAAALLIGWSRLCLGVHFPSDVLAGALVGWLAALTVQQAWLRAAISLRRPVVALP